MALTAGTRLGPYEITTQVGRGGMGEVWCATDVNLGRQVAIKVLPHAFAQDPDRLARFEREAKTLASLNHPNIAQVYGLEKSAGTTALVMELVDGPTLADRIAQGPIPIDDALPIAKQIAEALEAAHEQGIIHRDLKPANVKVRPDGIVKVLDFGLAKALEPVSAGSTDATSSTITSPAMLTRVGVILGTSAYMSPEQAKGRATDKRADIWAFGCVLYEMLTGRRAFQRVSVSETLAAVLTNEPDWSLLPPETPESISRLLRRCLQKEPNRRLRDFGDARIEIEDTRSDREVIPAEKRTSARRGRREVLAWGVAALCLILLAVDAVYLRPTNTPARVVRFQVPVGQSRSFSDRGYAISPDGTRLVFVATGTTGDDVLWVRRLDTLEMTSLRGTEDAYSPFWSPDSESIAFFADGRLKRTPASGGAVQTLCEVLAPASVPAGAWSVNGTIIFAQSFGPIRRVSSQGGESTPVTSVNEERQEFGHYDPVFFPDGEHFAYEVGALPERLGIHVSSLRSSNTIRLLPRSTVPFVVTANGFLLFVDQGVLRAQRLDLNRLETVGENVVVATGIASLSASSDGTIAYRNTSSTSTQLTWFDRSGKQIGTVSRPGDYLAPMLSPDESKVAVVRDGDIWVLDLVRGTESRLTDEPSPELWPLWSPDGSEILYSGGVLGSLVKRASSGTGEEEVVLDRGGAIPWDWSSDGRFITYAAPGPGTFLDLYVLPLFGERTPELYLQTKFQDVENKLSPDGTRMAYASHLSGRSEIYVQAFPASPERWQISTSGGTQPSWRGDGRELYYVGLDGRLMAADITITPIFTAGVPRPLFQVRGPARGGRNSYVPSRDGQRFLVNARVEGARPEIVVLMNWTAAIPD